MLALDGRLVEEVFELRAAGLVRSLEEQRVEAAANEVRVVFLQIVETDRALRDGTVLPDAPGTS